MSSAAAEILDLRMLEGLPAHLRPVRAGAYTRAGCPFHGSDKQRSLSISNETGRFQCHSCGVWGYTAEARERWLASRPQFRGELKPWDRRTGVDRLRVDSATQPEPMAEERIDRLGRWQRNLDLAQEYLDSRRIPIEVAREFGAGAVRVKGVKRIVLPHTDAQGRIVSLYGRRIDGGTERVHHHAARPKGWLSTATRGRELWITEGAFDALALRAAGVTSVTCIFGVNGLRWSWIRGVRRLVFAFDADEAGERAIAEHAKQAALRGIEIARITREELGGRKDVAAAWEAGVLNLQPLEPLPAEASQRPLSAICERIRQLPEEPPSGVNGLDWADYLRVAHLLVDTEHEGATLADRALVLGLTARELLAQPEPPALGGVAWTMRAARRLAIRDGHISGEFTGGHWLTHHRVL